MLLLFADPADCVGKHRRIACGFHLCHIGLTRVIRVSVNAAKSVKPADTPDFVHASCPACDRHSSGLGVAPPARCYLPAHSPEARSRCAYLVLLRAEIARFTQTELARLCCSDPQLMPCGFHWRAVSSCAALCSPDVPPVRGFPHNAYALSLRYAPATA